MYSFTGRIRYSECDHNGFLRFSSLMNYFQDCSTFQSEDLQIGIEYLKKQNKVWVVSVWQIVVNRYPTFGEEVEIGTFPYEFKGCLGYRNFFMRTTDGEMLAMANSMWTLLSIDSRTIARPTQEMLERYVLEPRLDMNYAPRKVAVPEGGEEQEPIVISKQHLDTNGHVNNEQYIELAMAYLPEETKPGQMRAEYKKEAHLGDVFHPYVVREDGKTIISLRSEQGDPFAVIEFS